MDNSIIAHQYVNDPAGKLAELAVYRFLDGKVLLAVNGAIGINLHITSAHARAFGEAILATVPAPAEGESA